MMGHLLKIVAVKFNLLFITFCSIFLFKANSAYADAFSHLEMKTADDSIFFMDSYNRLKDDKKMHLPTMQEHKQEVQHIVNTIINSAKNNGSYDVIGFIHLAIPDFRQMIDHKKIEINPDGTDMGNSDEGDYYEPKEYTTLLTYVTVKGDTVEKEIGHIDFAMEMAKQIVKLNEKFGAQHPSDNKFRYGDILLTAFNMALQDDTKEMGRFMNETKQKYINKELAKYTPKGVNKNELACATLNSKADSISFAKGYFTGKSAADTLTIKDNYDFLEGTTIGYEARISKIGKIGWLQIMNIMESRPLANQLLFMQGIEVGAMGEKEGYEPSFIPGAYYGYAGERTQWNEKDMEAYLKKNVLDPSSLFGTWAAYKVEMDDNGTNKISAKDRKQSTKKILNYKIDFIDDQQFNMNKGGTKVHGVYAIIKNTLNLLPNSGSFSFEENKTVAEIVSEKDEFIILSRTEKEMVLRVDDSKYDYSVTIYFRKQ